MRAQHIMCHRRYTKDGTRCHCTVSAKDCPLVTKKFKKLEQEPCCLAIWIPARYLDDQKTDRPKSTRKYLEECVL